MIALASILTSLSSAWRAVVVISGVAPGSGHWCRPGRGTT